MLADPNDDILTLANGDRIIKSTGRVIRDKQVSTMIEIPSPRAAQEIVAKTRRGVADMPVAPGQMNAISLCVFYTMWGLTNQDIAIQLNVTTQQVGTIKRLPEFQKLYDDIFKGVMETEANDVRGYFQQRARNAAEKIVTLAETEEGALGFAAAKDVLDRAGHRPADVVEHRHRLDNSLQIEIIKKDHSKDAIPVIDAEYTEVN